MSKNIEINIQTTANTYETLYPKTLGSLVDGAVSLATNATNATNANSASQATKLSTARTIRTNLSSTSTASFDGTSNITPGITGTLSVSYGGTGVTSYSSLASQLSSYMSSKLTFNVTTATSTGSNTTEVYISNVTSKSLFIIDIDSTGQAFTTPNNYTATYYPIVIAIPSGSSKTVAYVGVKKGANISTTEWEFSFYGSNEFDIYSNGNIKSGQVVKVWYA